ncbi:Uu.00g089030.m01.CDS01 [Anthostomella pinea]|uniref:Uu.00g089030.m01.CDS01 n=1 Tax=Anthostomella pinea TaxID=933095 RepID=A0AAI8VN91_9PEZI|nr:Uu.00g089030.m01.CDS01 [Anthostomella pinea]
MKVNRSAVFLTLSGLLLPVANVLFLSGLLRPKPVLPVVESTGARRRPRERCRRERPASPGPGGVHARGRAPEVNKHVTLFPASPACAPEMLIVTSDFVLIRKGAAVPFTALAGPPNLTMPRVKAMTTGSSPCFLDILLNVRDN